MAAEKLPDKSCKYPPAKRPRNTGDGITQKHIGINKPKIGYPKYGGAGLGKEHEIAAETKTNQHRQDHLVFIKN